MSSRIVVGIGGGIAAYKVCAVISALVKSGAEVKAILTPAAQEFITPLTITTLCRQPVYQDASLWHPHHTRPLHIELGEWADLLVLAPLTANTLAKLAMGLADNLLTNTVLASTVPILVAPAMNTTMWRQPVVQRNWHQLLEDLRYHPLGPAAGMLACDTVGEGRMAEPADLLTYIDSLLMTKGKRDLSGKHVLISAGGTREHLDPVRFIGNPSSGKMGQALALAAWSRGAEVQLVHGPLATPLPRTPQLETLAVTSAEDMRAAVLEVFPTADWTIMAAAVGDVKPAHYYAEKQPKKSLPADLPLKPIPDILAELGQQKRPHQKLIGFAAQTGDIITPAQAKLERKRLDAIVANPIDQPQSGFGSDQNQAVFMDVAGHQVPIPQCSKLHMAHHVLDLIRDLA
ncbi:bifunctional phosphopantothenoylcysteine decarboxylase/phosphopantothenate--cysteine ligase CoaBC [Acaryochloris sp. IP29b_bin.137]|uniref:bifunctional phosphopantothenoylcysteine decarboxylase/phosphopantothenate--cysteine ligase CoaBC n=1 Tax=Acaryochloris sp. IP29b_bin.137 TaxID=2969217 RepID=UPI002632C069|nr:bifunctional phosphopantothenoylcysteine decarboxylase/phosphopantothenate--cysteine ligase CoaBC [Acaryochloris sp. IP29b_bin.137]